MILRTPVALFVFNRPEPTRRVFETIRAARPERLFVVADGPRPDRPDDLELCARTREVVAAVDWSCEVERVYAEMNLGCGRRVSSGLDCVFDAVDEAIILEDDCLPDHSFFAFCAALLERYRDDERVGMVTGTSYLPDPGRYESYVFARYFPVWGWASWSRAWSAYDFRMTGWERMKAAGGLDGVLGSRGLERWLSGAFDSVQGGTVDTWDFQWVHALLRQNALCAIPRVNLVTNIGLEGTRGAGSTVGMPSQELVPPFVEPPTFLPDVAYESRLYEEFLRAPRGGQLRQQTITKVRRVLRA